MFYNNFFKIITLILKQKLLGSIEFVFGVLLSPLLLRIDMNEYDLSNIVVILQLEDL